MNEYVVRLIIEHMVYSILLLQIVKDTLRLKENEGGLRLDLGKGVRLTLFRIGHLCEKVGST